MLAYTYFPYKGNIADANGNTIKTISISPYVWRNDSEVLGYNGDTYSFNIKTDSLIYCMDTAPPWFYAYNREKECFYDNVGIFFRVFLKGEAMEDIRRTYDSHDYGIGDYSPKAKKFVIPLLRRERHGKDPKDKDEYSSLILMNEDCTNERMILIPE